MRIRTHLRRRFQVRTFLILWLFLLSAVGFMDRTNISIAGPAIRSELRLDDVHLGWVFSAFLLGYAAFQVVRGWLASFWFSAAAGLVVGLVWYAMARDVPEEHPLVSPEELAHIQANRSGERARRTEDTESWKAAIWNRNVVALTLSYFTFGYVAWIFFSWFFIYMAQVRGLNLKAGALGSVIAFMAMTVCFLGGRVLSARL